MTLLKTKKHLRETNWKPCHMHLDFPEERCNEIQKKIAAGYGRFVGPILLIAPTEVPMVLDIAGRAGIVKNFAFQIKRVTVQVGEVLVLRHDCVHRTGAPILAQSVYNKNQADWLTDDAPRLHILFQSEQTLYENEDGETEERNQGVVLDFWEGATTQKDFYNKWFFCFNDETGEVKLRDGMSEDPGHDYHERKWDSLATNDF
jgi:hypothetical protein